MTKSFTRDTEVRLGKRRCRSEQQTFSRSKQSSLGRSKNPRIQEAFILTWDKWWNWGCLAWAKSPTWWITVGRQGPGVLSAPVQGSDHPQASAEKQRKLHSGLTLASKVSIQQWQHKSLGVKTKQGQLLCNTRSRRPHRHHRGLGPLVFPRKLQVWLFCEKNKKKPPSF